MVQRRRHVAKALSWRAVGTLDTVLLSWFITGDPVVGLSIGFFETVTKTVLYYIHERAWYEFSSFGVAEKGNNERTSLPQDTDHD